MNDELEQLELFDLPSPRTGRTHPATAYEAGQAAKRNLTKKRLEVLLAYAAFGAMTDNGLREYLNTQGQHSESGPRARRSELLEAHLVEAVGERRNEAGNRVLVFDLSDEGRTFLEDKGLWTFNR